MTEVKESPIKYLDRDNIESLYEILGEIFNTSTEPIPPFSATTAPLEELLVILRVVATPIIE